ncbi:hypothetical protein [Mangrovibacterium sp.]|uniref:hypothetical protein n=1 Tax=Mangrovibacterium sp. TaxID=1961364 RepID=UPI0035688C1F
MDKNTYRWSGIWTTIVLLLALWGCGNNTQKIAEPVENMVTESRSDDVVTDSVAVEPEPIVQASQQKDNEGVASVISKSPVLQPVEAIKKPAQKVTAPASELFPGQMMVYAPDSMSEHREEKIIALVQQQIDESSAIREIARSLQSSEQQVAGDTNIHDIKLSDSLRVSLVFNPDDFKLISDQSIYYSRFVKGQTHYFDWEVEPQSPGEKTLTIKIENYVNGSWNNFASPQTIKIQVKVNQGKLWTGIWDNLQNDPTWLLDKVMLPVLAFIAGLFATFIKRRLFGSKEE